MKKRNILVAFGLLLVSFSCNKGFLEIEPVSTVSTSALYKSDDDFKGAEIGIYQVLQDQYDDMWLFGDMRGDDSWDELNKGTPAAFDNFTVNNDDGVIKSTWLNYYTIIYRANTILSKINDVDVTLVPNKDAYIGEARFLRALAYFDLVRIYGDVPMITAPLSLNEAYEAGRKSVDSIYSEVIIPDLLDAESTLPLTYSGNDLGRATKGAAKALLGTVYLTLHDFGKAETKLQEVTTMGYSLLANYNDLFDYNKDQHNSEYIFNIEYSEGKGQGSNFTTNFCPKNIPIATFYGVTGGQNGANNPPKSLFAKFPPGDLRKAISAADGYTDADGVFHALIPSSNDVSTFTAKYMVPVPGANDSKANWKVIRYADVLLMYAEALNENGKTSEAIKYLNMVHERAGLAAYSNLTQSDAREKIYLERELELSFEGHRWFDLIRTGRALSVMAPLGMKDYMTVFPIPLSQIQVMNNSAIFAQNPGYD